jgi:hypothetical protein
MGSRGSFMTIVKLFCQIHTPNAHALLRGPKRVHGSNQRSADMLQRAHLPCCHAAEPTQKHHGTGLVRALGCTRTRARRHPRTARRIERRRLRMRMHVTQPMREPARAAAGGSGRAAGARAASAADAQHEGPLEAVLPHAHARQRQQRPAGRVQRLRPARRAQRASGLHAHAPGCLPCAPDHPGSAVLNVTSQ